MVRDALIAFAGWLGISVDDLAINKMRIMRYESKASGLQFR